MSTHEDEARALRFRGIRETCSRIEYCKGFALRLLNGLYRCGALPDGAIAPDIKGQLAMLDHPNRNEASALRKLSRTVFNPFTRNINLKPKGFRAGFVCAVLLDLERALKDPTMTEREREAFLSLVIPVLGCGPKADESSIEKLNDLFTQQHNLYAHAYKLPEELHDDFFEGFKAGNNFVTIGDKILLRGPDSTKICFLIVLLGKSNRLLRSVTDLYRFIHQETNLKLTMDWDSFKSACKDVSWRGVKFLRSRRSRKIGVSVKPAIP